MKFTSVSGIALDMESKIKVNNSLMLAPEALEAIRAIAQRERRSLANTLVLLLEEALESRKQVPLTGLATVAKNPAR